MTAFTKNAIKTTFIELLEEKPLSKITVREIVERCGINRNSFYYHYSDIPALVEEIFIDDADRIIAAHASIDTIEECLRAVLDFAGEHKRAILHVYRSVNRDVFERYLWKVCEYVVVTYGKAAFADSAVGETDKDVIQKYYRALFFGLIAEWLNDGMKDDIYAFTERLCELKRGATEEMIARSKR